jgi:hypothetical protein
VNESSLTWERKIVKEIVKNKCIKTPDEIRTKVM